MRTTCRYFCALLLLVAAACGDSPVTQPSSPGSVVGLDLSPIEPVDPVEPPEEPPYPAQVPIYRWFNGNIGHLFGIHPDEGYPYGYVLEHNPAFHLFDTKPSYKYVQIYRCWRHSNNQHFMTTSATCDGEANVTREDEDGIYGLRPQYVTGNSGLVPLYRLSLPGHGDDLVTTDAAERDQIIAYGWQYKGILAYVVPA